MSALIRVGIIGSTLERECIAKALALQDSRVQFVFDCPFEEVAREMPRHKPDHLLVCVGDSYLASYESVRALRERHPHLNVIVLVRSFGPSGAVDLLLAGATAVFSFEQHLADLGALVWNVSHQQVVYPPEITTHIIERLRQQGCRQVSASQMQYDALTTREREIADLLGFSNKDIARKLFLSLHTVKNHIHRIIEKLDVTNRREAALYIMCRRSATLQAPLQSIERPQLVASDGSHHNGTSPALAAALNNRRANGT